ncbi:hypothetical protein VP01_499g2 [Puccinia sorghi]|uniref:Uncharacterized protein n=1 Tax=Puccinia sorghi TaxID=27349 RepID=A0A0L6UNR9_9BASI|nr:hypothetical protein VP01_499g2 [Puccinia sorghi]
MLFCSGIGPHFFHTKLNNLHIIYVLYTRNRNTHGNVFIQRICTCPMGKHPEGSHHLLMWREAHTRPKVKAMRTHCLAGIPLVKNLMTSGIIQRNNDPRIWNWRQNISSEWPQWNILVRGVEPPLGASSRAASPSWKAIQSSSSSMKMRRSTGFMAALVVIRTGRMAGWSRHGPLLPTPGPGYRQSAVLGNICVNCGRGLQRVFTAPPARQKYLTAGPSLEPPGVISVGAAPKPEMTRGSAHTSLSSSLRKSNRACDQSFFLFCPFPYHTVSDPFISHICFFLPPARWRDDGLDVAPVRKRSGCETTAFCGTARLMNPVRSKHFQSIYIWLIADMTLFLNTSRGVGHKMCRLDCGPSCLHGPIWLPNLAPTPACNLPSHSHLRLKNSPHATSKSTGQSRKRTRIRKRMPWNSSRHVLNFSFPPYTYTRIISKITTHHPTPPHSSFTSSIFVDDAYTLSYQVFLLVAQPSLKPYSSRPQHYPQFKQRKQDYYPDGRLEYNFVVATYQRSDGRVKREGNPVTDTCTMARCKDVDPNFLHGLSKRPFSLQKPHLSSKHLPTPLIMHVAMASHPICFWSKTFREMKCDFNNGNRLSTRGGSSRERILSESQDWGINEELLLQGGQVHTKSCILALTQRLHVGLCWIEVCCTIYEPRGRLYAQFSSSVVPCAYRHQLPLTHPNYHLIYLIFILPFNQASLPLIAKYLFLLVLLVFCRVLFYQSFIVLESLITIITNGASPHISNTQPTLLFYRGDSSITLLNIAIRVLRNASH